MVVAVRVLGEDPKLSEPFAHGTSGQAGELDACPQAAPAHLGDRRCRQAGEPVVHVGAKERRTPLELARSQHRDHLTRDRAGQRVPAERGPVLTRPEHAKHGAARHDRGDRHDPAAKRLAEQVYVGLTFSCSHANVVPVRPSPDWISSAIMSAPRSEQICRTPARKPGGGTTTPASPWMGSTSTAAQALPASSIAAASASRSPYGTSRNPGVYGP